MNVSKRIILDSAKAVDQLFDLVWDKVAARRTARVLLFGRQAGGLTMIARRLAAIVPPPSVKEKRVLRDIYSSAGLLREDQDTVRIPFRAPHHTVSVAGLVGMCRGRNGQMTMRPGEVSLAHGGTLFLDEIDEFGGQPLDYLWHALRDGYVSCGGGEKIKARPKLVIGAVHLDSIFYKSDSDRVMRLVERAFERTSDFGWLDLAAEGWTVEGTRREPIRANH
jgi:sigma54-dependent transcription regulator